MRIQRLACLLLLLGHSIVTSANENPLEEGGQAYVHSPNGLNLRKGPSLTAPRIVQMPYGSEVEVLSEPNTAQNINFEYLVGPWVHVKYQQQEGYAFGGYLSHLPTPSSNSFAEYQAILQESETPFKPADGIQPTANSTSTNTLMTLVLKNAEFRDGFLIARRLFSIPPRFTYPLDSPMRVVIINDPVDPQKLSDKSMEVVRNETGQIQELIYYEKIPKGRPQK